MISFTVKATNFSLKNRLAVRKWIQLIIQKEGKSAGEIAYIFCDDEFLLNLNRTYLNHHTLTDIITFDYTESGRISGDIFISMERVKDNALTFSKTLGEELGRVMAHGVLHLAGYTDKKAEQQLIMREKEDFYLGSFPNL